MAQGGKREGAGSKGGNKGSKHKDNQGVSKPLSIRLNQSEQALRAIVKKHHTDRAIYVMGMRSLVRDGLLPPDALSETLEKLR